MDYNYLTDINHLNKMYPDGGTNLNGKWYDNEEIAELDLHYINSYLQKPIRDVPEYEQEIVWSDDGSIQRNYTYNIYSNNAIDGLNLLNVYGQKLYNDFCKTKEQEEVTITYDFESDYSRL